MGARLAVNCYATWSTLPDRPFRLLVHMALTARDDDEKPRYFGGRHAMTLALGLNPDDATHRTMASRAATQLAAAGAVSRVEGTGFRGKRQEYLIHAYRVTTESPNKPEEVAGKGDSTVGERVTPQSRKGDSTVTERVTPQSPQLLREEPQRSEMEEEISSSTQPSPTRARNDGRMDYFTAREYLHAHTSDGGLSVMAQAGFATWHPGGKEERVIAAAEHLKAEMEKTA